MLLWKHLYLSAFFCNSTYAGSKPTQVVSDELLKTNLDARVAVPMVKDTSIKGVVEVDLEELD
jgi:hypothetical protein